MIKTLVVDDSDLVRSILKDFLESDGGFIVVGEASNGREGFEKARLLNPDLITMDIEMPVMGGLEAIQEIRKVLPTPVVVISTHDTAKMAYEATVKGAMEFYSKDNFTATMNPFKRIQILEALKQIAGTRSRRAGLANLNVNEEKKNILNRAILAVVIASSTGGPKALTRLCAGLPGNFPAPIILVQHNTSGFDKGFVQWLNDYTPLEVKLAEQGELPLSGKLYVAPTDKHLIMDVNGFAFDNGEMVNNQKPAADLLFKSAAKLLGKGLISVVLTGMGADGAEGTRFVKNGGGITLAQDEGTSLIYGMPKAAFDTGAVDMVLPLESIAGRLVELTKV
ncbi:chemotaxis response regulator protein-glutamate methylesterase [Treponema primitia ZAS-2]|uniref:Protein-glutamate methylesterase/protein-glutamine glutaminase n=1 Tax=Treponema primitia (strain ATCC BAA-887 / DSM 12427 / ZAS-2) TaxID=545694 RepID=F5YNN5_TREPZ|nr:chemotaxis-specific protein-glutamate methyltransferase CheB [Treponema primitia]AEF85901.1 chemotaxis response regulator protein-glutamate methylesterase [Treponema primitia ZAS-2]